ncbi:MAG: inositol monophosphatase [Actinobacteria bacterium]|uniref:inositol-phosphate phosphatase n=1 Tax=freshwater metagenome TaxID=449393 RepID=A0A6J7DPB4_9ZZZZ|nr:inositol monophosphatase [Actinomycetota bacterium]
MNAISIDLVLSLHPLLPIGWRAAGVAADFLANERPAALVVDTKSSPTDAVTEMDRGAEARLIDILLGERSTDGLLGEEGGERAGTSGVRWVVDPLDGTVNYLYGMPTWAVSVAAEVDGVCEVGVIVAPELGEAYIGVRGQGAWQVDAERAVPLRVRECTSLGSALIATGFGYAAERRRAQAAVLHELVPHIRDIRRAGAAVLDFAWLARGRLDGYYEIGLNRWDIAAGALIAAEAGARVGGLGSPDPYEGVMVAGVPGIHGALVDELVRSGARGLSA